MADKRISQLNPHTSPSGSDLLVIVNNNETKKITYADLTATITGSQVDISGLNAFTQSFNTFSSSVHSEIVAGTNEQDLSNLVTSVTLGILSGSIDGRLDNLELHTGSYVTTYSYNTDSSSFDQRIKDATNEQSFNGLISGSSQLTSSYDNRYVLSGSITQTTWNNIANKPNDIISSSAQITAYGFVSGSYETTGRGILSGSITSLLPSGVVSGSSQVLGGSGVVSGSYETTGRGIISSSAQLNGTTIDNLTITNLHTLYETSSVIYASGSNQFGDQLTDNHIFSGSIQVVGGLTINGVQVSTQSFVDLSSLNTFTSSANISITNLNNATSSYETTGRGIISSSAQINGFETTGRGILSGSVSYTSLTNIPSGLVSGSSQLTSSYDTRYTLSGSVGATPAGTISGSQQITNLGFINSSQTASFATTGSNQFNGSQSISGSITLSGSIENINYIDFNTASVVPAWKSGRMFWDNTDGTLAIYNAEADVTLQVGQENWTRVYNQTATTITNGTPVRISGTHGDVPEVELAQSLAVSGAINLVNQIIGLATHDIEAGTFGYITTQGLVRGVNTSAYSDGDTLYVSSSAGQLTHISPSAPYEIIPVGEVVKASPGGSGIIYVAVQQPLDFSDLSSTEVIGEYSNGDMWSYEGSGLNGKWKHKTIAEIGLITTSSFNSFTSSYYTTSASFDSRISSLVSAGVPAGTVSGSSQLTSSYDSRYVLSGSIQPLPTGVISSSAQIDTLFNLDGIISSSAQVTGFETIGRDIISSSAQITNLGFISSSADITSLNSFTSSYYVNSSSFDSRISALVNNTGSYETTGRGIISESVVTISGTTPSVGVGNLWYDNNAGNLYLKYDTNTWVDTSNGVIQTIISDGSLLSTASFNAWTASYTASVPAGTISGSSQIATLGFITSSTAINTGSFAITGSNQFNGNQTITGSLLVSSNVQTINGYVQTSLLYNGGAMEIRSFYQPLQINPNGAGLIINDTTQISGSLRVSGSLTASLQNGYMWVGDSSNRAIAATTSSLLSTASFNSWTGSSFNSLSSSLNALSQSANTTDIITSQSIATLQASLGVTSTPFTYINVVNPTNYVLVSYPTASYNGGSMDIIITRASDSTATSANCLLASFGGAGDIAVKGSQNSGAGAPNPSFNMALSGSNMNIRISIASGTYGIKGVARLF